MIKKIKTKESIEKEKRRNQLIVGLIMIGLIVLSSAGYAIMSQDSSFNQNNKAKYGNVIFSFLNGYWQTTISGKTLFFNNLPGNVTSIPISGNISLEIYSDKTVYIVNSNSAVASISSALEGVALKMQEACINESGCIENNLPMKDCSSPLIIYKPADNASVKKIDNCVYLEGDFFTTTDRFIYRLFDIA